MRRKLLLLMTALITALVCLAWFWGGRDFAGKDIRNVLLVSIDTCRADYLSCYGYPRKTTPNIDAIAREGILFENVISPVPITLPAHASMLTGTNPIYHGIYDNNDYRLGQFNITLAEILKDSGFTTGAVISAFVLDSRFGIRQGFDSYNDRIEDRREFSTGIDERKGAETSQLAAEWLNKHKDEKFFLFLHYYDPHRYYEPPEPFASEYAANLYAGEIAYTDYCIGQVINKLKEMKLYDSTLVIITSDHGEMLGEHDEATHGYFIYQGGIRVPLIFKLPRAHRSKVITQRAGLIDIVPTVCGLLGIEEPSNMQGMDLSSGFGSNKLPDRPRYLYCGSLEPTKYDAASLLGVVTDRWKYIQTTSPELYDLVKDPAESRNLLESKPEQARLLKGHLKLILKEQFRKVDADSRLELDEQALEKLRGLGYVGGGVDESLDLDQTGIDPKNLIDIHNLYIQTSSLVILKKYEEAEVLCKKLFSLKPDFWGAHYYMALIRRARGDISGAIRHLQQSLKSKPDQAEAHNNLAIMLGSRDRFDEAIHHYSQALKYQSHNPLVHFNLSQMLIRQGKYDQAVKHLKETIKLKPDLAKAHNNLAKLLETRGEFDNAINHYSLALKYITGNPLIHFNMGLLLIRQTKYEQAIHHFNEALRLQPDFAKAHYELGSLYFQQGRFNLTITHWTKAVSSEPDSTQALNNLAWILAAYKDTDFYNPEKAVGLAKRCCELTNYENPGFLDTLSVAYASAGRFSDAVSTAQKALETAEAGEQKTLAREIRNHLDLYMAGDSYSETLPKTPVD